MTIPLLSKYSISSVNTDPVAVKTEAPAVIEPGTTLSPEASTIATPAVKTRYSSTAAKPPEPPVWPPPSALPVPARPEPPPAPMPMPSPAPFLPPPPERKIVGFPRTWWLLGGGALLLYLVVRK